METFNPTTQDLEFAISTILRKFDNPEREGLKDTPKRYIKALTEILTPQPFTFTTFDAQGYDQMIIEKGLEFHTLCEHHLLPFFGTVTIAYIPDKKIVGISKLARTVETFSKRLNTQEYFTNNIANFIEENLKPKGVAVLVEGRHMCKEMRGIKKRGNMITSCLKGVFLEDIKVKEEFLNLIQKG